MPPSEEAEAKRPEILGINPLLFSSTKSILEKTGSFQCKNIIY